MSYKLLQPNELSNNIRKKAKEKGYNSIKSIAKETGIDFTTISRWNIYYPNLYNLISVANALDCTLDDLIEVKDNGD